VNLCPLSGLVVPLHDRRGRFSREAYCPHCDAVVSVFRTSEPLANNVRYASHEEDA